MGAYWLFTKSQTIFEGRRWSAVLLDQHGHPCAITKSRNHAAAPRIPRSGRGMGGGAARGRRASSEPVGQLSAPAGAKRCAEGGKGGGRAAEGEADGGGGPLAKSSFQLASALSWPREAISAHDLPGRQAATDNEDSRNDAGDV